MSYNNVKNIELDGARWVVTFYVPEYHAVEMNDKTYWVINDKIKYPVDIERYEQTLGANFDELFKLCKAHNLIEVSVSNEVNPTRFTECMIIPEFMLRNDDTIDPRKLVPYIKGRRINA